MQEKIVYPDIANLLPSLRQTPTASLDLVVLITGAWPSPRLDELRAYLDECGRVLREGGLLFVQGRPDTLPELGVYLDQILRFRYWIAVESAHWRPTAGLPSVHAAILFFSKGERFDLQRVRFPHDYCAFCGRTRRDWGGKSHLLNPQGVAISDVWKGIPPADNYRYLSPPVLETILKLAGCRADEARDIRGLVAPKEGLAAPPSSGVMGATESRPLRTGAAALRPYSGMSLVAPVRAQRRCAPTSAGDGLWDRVWQGDALEILRRYPDESVDLAFADPPYNLDKAYHVYEDEQERREYLEWCQAWLEEYIRLLKPTGSLYILNLPHWAMYHADFLNRRLHFQNWIVWDALSEPRGKLLPAHYSLLFYTKHPTEFTFNYAEVGEITSRIYCLRSSCIRQRIRAGMMEKEPLTDLWWDIHRLKHRRSRDVHPCQLPEPLLERIIRLSTNPGDIVVDALAGTGTTAVVAARLGRRYVAVDIDPAYVQLIRQKLEAVQTGGYVARPSVPRPRPRYSKKALQLELRNLAMRLGRLPTPEDVRALSRYDLEVFLEAFPSWGKALKAAKLEVRDAQRKISFDKAWETMAVFFVEDALENEIDEKVKNLLDLAQEPLLDGTGSNVDVDSIAGFLASTPDALDVILRDIGLSDEKFMRIISLLRRKVSPDAFEGEWNIERIKRELAKPEFSRQIAELLIDGKRDPDLAGLIPRYYLEMLDHRNVPKDIEFRRVRYKQSLIGTYSGRKGHRVEGLIRKKLEGI